MNRHKLGGLGRGFALVALLAVTLSGIGRAQEASPVATPTAGISLAAGNLTNPRGMTWDASGALVVALAGAGGTTLSSGTSAHEQEHGSTLGGDSASVVRIEGGCPVTIATGLPSTRGMNGHDQGPAAVAFIGDQLYVLQDAGDAAAEVAPNQPNGVYAVEADGSVRLVANVSAWIDANPVANIPYDKGKLGETFAMVSDGTALWVAESNSGQVLRITPDGAIRRVADLSLGHPVPTGIAMAPGGGVYVGFLTPAPYLDGSSKVVKIGADGIVSDVWTGLTMITALAVGADGALYALEMATGNTEQPPYVTFGTGRVLRQTGPASSTEVATGLDFPIAMSFGPDGGLYVSTPAFGGDDDPGGIVRLEVGGAQPLIVPGGILDTSTCASGAVDATPLATPAAAPAAATPAEIATVAPGAPAASPPPAAEVTGDNDGKGGTGALAVTIQNFAFNPPTLEIPVGAVVTWTNLDTVPHTATAANGTFDSGNLNPGQSYSVSFDEPGTVGYGCSYHPSMVGTIIVR